MQVEQWRELAEQEEGEDSVTFIARRIRNHILFREAVPETADMLRLADEALSMVTPGMWHEVDDWLAEWRGKVANHDN